MSAQLSTPAPQNGKSKRGPGRPSIFTPELADRICEQIANGQSLRRICQAGDMPHETSIYGWLSQDPDFSSKYVHARERQGDLMDEQQMELCQQIRAKEIGAPEARVIAGVLQWRAAKLAPKKYGEKLDINHGGEVTLLNDIQLDARIAALGSTLVDALNQAAVLRLDEAAGREDSAC